MVLRFLSLFIMQLNGLYLELLVGNLVLGMLCLRFFAMCGLKILLELIKLCLSL